MRLSGARFDAKGMPAESLLEVAAFEDILRSLVKLYWLERHPLQKRVPNGYDDLIALRLVQKIGEGSAKPQLEYDLGAGAIDMFAEDELEHDYGRALETVEAFIDYAQTGNGTIPGEIRRLHQKVKKLGQTMQAGDAIQVAATDVADWKPVPKYDNWARKRVMRRLEVDSARPVTITGHVIDIHVLSGRLIVRDREHRADVQVPYLDSGVKVNVDSGRQLFKCSAEGIGHFNANNRLIKLDRLKSLSVVEFSEDAQLARASVDALADLAEGWMDGESGEAISKLAIERAHTVIEAMISLGNFTRTIFPTEEGGIRFYWPEAENQLTIDVEPSGSLYIHAADVEAGTFDEGTIAADISDLAEALDSWLSEAGDR
ncbi:hypothetical protein FNL39_105393 [Nocardia caishijiensis]|uniref:Uncharacterized protein n=2 Tax=Nocardia caishijiensis TaxID=184756 RepID=A0ABQ6YL28_9NOCA|nr:hypothetical protein FNL39_105393 [Nocardia caishijiensis]